MMKKTIRKLLCRWGYHPWVYWDMPRSRTDRSYRICPDCKAVEYTANYWSIWHRLYPGDVFYIKPEYILNKEDTY